MILSVKKLRVIRSYGQIVEDATIMRSVENLAILFSRL